jgi:hypothetical protein
MLAPRFVDCARASTKGGGREAQNPIDVRRRGRGAALRRNEGFRSGYPPDGRS